MSKDRDDAAQPLWKRVLVVLICLTVCTAIGWAFGGADGALIGGIIGLGLALLAILAPGLFVWLYALLEVLGSCS